MFDARFYRVTDATAMNAHIAIVVNIHNVYNKKKDDPNTITVAKFH